jgi:hypothetical protein
MLALNSQSIRNLGLSHKLSQQTQNPQVSQNVSNPQLPLQLGNFTAKKDLTCDRIKRERERESVTRRK